MTFVRKGRLSSVVSLMVGVALLAVLAACGSPEPTATPAPQPGPGTTPTPGAQPTPAPDFDAAAYFRGKTVRFIVPFQPGGGTDTQARFLAANLGQFIPGNPRIVVSNQTPRIAGINYIAAAPGDGLTLMYEASWPYGLQNDPAARFDAADFGYIWAITRLNAAWFVTSDVPYDSFLDARGGTHTLRLPSSISAGTMSATDFASSVVAEAFDLPLQLIPQSVTGTNPALLGIERGDFNSYNASTVWWSMPRLRPGWTADGTVKPFVYLERPGVPMHPNTETDNVAPTAGDHMEGEWAEIWETLVVPQIVIGKLAFAPPDTPDHILNALRQGFEDALNDPTFRSELEQVMGDDATDMPGEELQAFAQQATTDFDFGRFEELRETLYNKFTQPR